MLKSKFWGKKDEWNALGNFPTDPSHHCWHTLQKQESDLVFAFSPGLDLN